MTPSALIRLLVRSFVEEYERNNGRIALPPRWHTTLPSEPSPAGGDTVHETPFRRVAEPRHRYPNRNGQRRSPA